MESQENNVQKLKNNKKICKTRITKSSNKIQNLIHSDSGDDIQGQIISEYTLFNEYHKELKQIFNDLQNLFIDDEDNLNNCIEEEHEIRSIYNRIKTNVKKFLFDVEANPDESFCSIYSSSSRHTTVKVDLHDKRTSTPEPTFYGFTEELSSRNTIDPLKEAPAASSNLNEIEYSPIVQAQSAFTRCEISSPSFTQKPREVSPAQELEKQLRSELFTTAHPGNFFTPSMPMEKSSKQDVPVQTQNENRFHNLNSAPQPSEHQKPPFQAGFFEKPSTQFQAPRFDFRQQPQFKPMQVPPLQNTFGFQPMSQPQFKPRSQPQSMMFPPQFGYPYQIPVSPYTSMHMQPISITPFNGSYDQWETFRDSFEAMVNQTNMTTIEKFHRLKQLLTGSAASFIMNVQISDSNYFEVWEDIKGYYDNPRRITMSYLQGLYDLKPVKSQKSSELRHLVDTYKNHLRGLKSAGQSENVDLFKIQLLLTKLDDETRMKWEGKMSTVKTLPKLQDLYDMLEKRIRTLEVSTPSSSESIVKQLSKTDSKSRPKQHVYSAVKKSQSCKRCNEAHSIYKCPIFVESSDEDRLSFINERRLCHNCLQEGHFASKCYSGHCRVEGCNQKHHTILHTALTTKKETCLTSISLLSKLKETMLCTAKLVVFDSNGKPHHVRALLDPGSQRSFMTAATAKKLNLSTLSESLDISGIGKTSSTLTQSVEASIQSSSSKYNQTVKFSLMEDITESLPQDYIDIKDWKIPKTIQLADPYFNKPGKIDLLLSASIFYDVLDEGILNLGKNEPKLVNTQLGWIVGGGSLCTNVAPRSVACHALSQTAIDKQIQKFWTIESFPNDQKIRSSEDQECEEHFVKTCQRLNNRFVVRLPFKNEVQLLGDNNKTRAEACWKSTEKKFQKDGHLKEMYDDFMFKYSSLNHMVEVSDMNSMKYFIPHHSVWKKGTKEEKFRVVFNASSRTANGTSFNDMLKVGPCIQDDLTSLLLRFRKHPIAIVGDIEKMYRQIRLHEDDQAYQGIVYREDSNKPIKMFKLCTITYGTGPGAFLATRCIREAVNLDGQKYPLASHVVGNDFYMDDLLSGATSIESAIELRKQVQDLLDLSSLPMRKWISNDQEVMQSIPLEYRGIDVEMNLDKEDAVKTLGMFWCPGTDYFKFCMTDFHTTISKRTILSDIAKLYDPLGLLGPVILLAKSIMQDLWKANLTWDQDIPLHLQEIWNKFKSKLNDIKSIRIDRKLLRMCSPQTVQLFGFSDASETGYGACIYIAATYSSEPPSSNLVCAKSRVAPIKVESIPRLELCGALLLAELMDSVKQALQIHIQNTFYFSDSKIVLAWIDKQPTSWKTFTANRVSKIQQLSSAEQWFHVPSKFNPADILSRGAYPEDLVDNELWWHGPAQLIDQFTSNQAPNDTSSLNNEEAQIVQSEAKILVHVVSIPEDSVVNDLYERHSNLNFILRTLVYVNRFIQNSRSKDPSKRKTGCVTYNELVQAKYILARHSQSNTFESEIKALKSKKPIQSSSKILSLNPFWDETVQLIRVGGRLKNAHISYDRKHPILISSKDKFTIKLCTMEHEKLLHAGPRLLLNHIRNNWWPINGLKLVTSIVHKCIICFKMKPKFASQIMGDLPHFRLTPSKPFLNCGVDFAGPIKTHQNESPRCRVQRDSYVCLFVCCSTKAVHMEVVSSLSTKAFIAAMRRFIARRGKVKNMYSDNGSNFVGAQNEFQRLLQQRETQETLQHEFEHMTWSFIPAASPHLGGIWEANIKCMKTHLYKIMGNNILNFEHFTTLIIQIEAVLNSRPICTLSSQPDEVIALTPGHFLTGSSLVTVPDEDFTDCNINRLDKWCLVQRMFQDFWSAWQTDYFSSLQNRYKWKQEQSNLNVGDVVLIKEDKVKPLHWRLGRVMTIFPDKDGRVRSVELIVNNHRTKRTVHKLCKLPLTDLQN